MENDLTELLSKQVSHSNENQSRSDGQYGSFNPVCSQQESNVLRESSSVAFPNGDECIPQPLTSLNIIGLSYTIKENPGHWWNGSCFKRSKLKTVLQNLNVTFTQGEITALIGSSGSGKTSLLDVISGRAQGDVTGLVTYKDEHCTRDMMKQVSSYVLQSDRLLPTLTVKETLTYIAYLKLPGHLNAAEIKMKVQSVITDMGLQHVAESRIGGAVVRGVSGGEKRRITIGVQLLKDPEILLLDEPTSGLDAFTAHQLVSSLAQLAHKGKLVILTIHQLRSDILHLLDKMALLTIGQLAYFGKPDGLIPYFTSIGYPCPRNQNPCDVYVDVTSVDRRSPSVEKLTYNKVQQLCKAFASSGLQANIVKHIATGLAHPSTAGNISYKACHVNEAPAWARTLFCLLRRMYVHLWRDRGAFLGRFLMLPFFVPFILIFLGRLNNNQESIQNRLGLLYQATQVTAYVGITHSIALFPVLRDLFYREYQDGLYSTFTFLFVYFLHSLPFNIVTVTTFGSAFYWIAGMNDDALAFGAFILVCLILVQFGETMTAGILGIFRNVQLANNTTALIFSASGLLASGLLRAVTNMPDFLQWAGYIAIHKYATEIVVSNEFHNLNFTCSLHLEQDAQCLTTGNSYLDMFYSDALGNMTRNFIILGGYSIAVLTLSVLMFKACGVPTLH